MNRSDAKPVSPTPPPESLPPEVELEAAAAQAASREERRLLLLVMVVAACVALVHLTPLRELVANVQTWKDRLRGWGLWAPVGYFTASTILVAMGVPRLALCAVAGMLFGFVEGSLVAQFSNVFGSYGTFLFARWGGRAWAVRRLAHNEKLRGFLSRPSLLTVFLVRQLPVAGIVPNLLLGLTAVRHRVFLIGTFLGYVPSTLIVVLVGSGLAKGSLRHALQQIVMALLALCAISLLAWGLRRKLARSDAASGRS